MDYDVKDLKLAPRGKERIEWAGSHMPVLKIIRENFAEDRPLEEVVIGACLHVTTETANLMIALKDGGAQVALCASNPLSTQDDVAASLVKDFEIPVFAVRGVDNKGYYGHIQTVIDRGPHITMDDGADLISTIHRQGGKVLDKVIGGTEETTTGVVRLRSMADQGVLKYPLVAVNEARTKYLFDNRYGTGQSTIDGILRATNFLLSGSVLVVAGYGWCGRGVAMRAKGMGARVMVTEVDPIKALEAVMDGFEVRPMDEAASVGDIFVTVTGDIDVITEDHFKKMKDGALLANAGHFNVEISCQALQSLAVSRREIRPQVEEFVMADGKRLYLLGEGRLVNLAAAEGHPAQVMDMSFANQALACRYLKEHHASLEPQVYPVPADLDLKVALLKLRAMGVGIDRLTPRQEEYLGSWDQGT